jgi:hypothetical protein
MTSIVRLNEAIKELDLRPKSHHESTSSSSTHDNLRGPDKASICLARLSTDFVVRRMQKHAYREWHTYIRDLNHNNIPLLYQENFIALCAGEIASSLSAGPRDGSREDRPVVRTPHRAQTSTAYKPDGNPGEARSRTLGHH